MEYNHKVVSENLPKLILWEFTCDTPYTPCVGHTIIVLDNRSTERWCKVIDVHHYLADRTITIITKPI